MNLPNLSHVVLRFSQTITKRVVTQSVVNHVPTETYIDGDYLAAVTTPSTKDLQTAEIDFSLAYKTIHSIDTIKIGDLFIHKSITYKVISLADREDYGYYRALGEETQL